MSHSPQALLDHGEPSSTLQLEGAQDRPVRRIGLTGALALVAGSMLGIGIFLAPVTMATHIHSPALFLGVWAFTGLIALAGATSYAELGVMMPHSGGDYVFHREALGSSVAFAYGWGLLSTGFAGSIAAMAVPLCTFQLGNLSGWPMSETALQLPILGGVQWAQLGAIVLIWLLTMVNIYGVKVASALQSLTTYIPLIALSALSLYVWSQPSVNTDVGADALSTHVTWSVSGITTAFLEAYFAYSGWNAVIYVAGEVERPQVTLPRALIGGTLVVMCLYLLFCSATLHGLGLDGLRSLAEGRQDIASALAEGLGSPLLLTLILSLISVALVASINATVIGGGRVGFALARDKAFWSGAARLHPTYQTPANALYAQALIASLAVLFIPWHLIFSVVSLVLVVGGAMTVGSLFVLRARQPNAERPYRALGYPWLPLLFIASAIFVVIVKLFDVYQGIEGAWYPVGGLLVVGVAFVLHRALQRRVER